MEMIFKVRNTLYGRKELRDGEEGIPRLDRLQMGTLNRL